MNRWKAIMLAVLVGSALPVAGQATPGPKAVAGITQLQDGRWFGIMGSTEGGSGYRGRAWIGAAATSSGIEVSLDCLDVAWHQPVYPIPPYLPFHLVQASGIGANGVRYFITAYDAVTDPVGFGDRAAVSTASGTGACGTDPDAAIPIKVGDINVLL